MNDNKNAQPHNLYWLKSYEIKTYDQILQSTIHVFSILADVFVLIPSTCVAVFGFFTGYVDDLVVPALTLLLQVVSRVLVFVPSVLAFGLLHIAAAGRALQKYAQDAPLLKSSNNTLLHSLLLQLLVPVLWCISYIADGLILVASLLLRLVPLPQRLLTFVLLGGSYSSLPATHMASAFILQRILKGLLGLPGRLLAGFFYVLSDVIAALVITFFGHDKEFYRVDNRLTPADRCYQAVYFEKNSLLGVVDKYQYTLNGHSVLVDVLQSAVYLFIMPLLRFKIPLQSLRDCLQRVAQKIEVYNSSGLDYLLGVQQPT